MLFMMLCVCCVALYQNYLEHCDADPINPTSREKSVMLSPLLSCCVVLSCMSTACTDCVCVCVWVDCTTES